MQVKELIKQLQAVDGELHVLTEGCDCWGPCSGVSIEDTLGGQRRVVLLRDDTIKLEGE